jgi:hypothetical protein
MPRPKKNPVSEMPVFEVQSVPNEPGIFERETDRTKSNVVPISTSSQAIENTRDWSAIDSVLSDVVSFG